MSIDNKHEADQFLEIGRNSPVTKVLYNLKGKGKVPYITFEVLDGEVKLARLVLGPITYYFHGTKDKDGKVLSVKQEPCPQENCQGKFFKIPFDGFEMAIQEDYPE